jgi:hypothetical protein
VTTQMIFYVVAAVCLLLAAFSVPTARVSTLALGMFFWLAAEKL